MILDNDMKFSVAQAITADAVSTNVLDRGVAGALGDDLWLVCRVHTAFDSAAEGASLRIGIETSDTEGSGYVRLLESPDILEADLDAANVEVFKVKLPRGLLRYIRLNYDVSGESFTAGKMDAFLTPGVEERP